MDNLSKDVMLARQLGYGTHYGAYKADHPHTKEEEPPAPPDLSKFRICPNCGKLFPKKGHGTGKVYCNEECRVAYSCRQQREATERRRAAASL